MLVNQYSPGFGREFLSFLEKRTMVAQLIYIVVDVLLRLFGYTTLSPYFQLTESKEIVINHY